MRQLPTALMLLLAPGCSGAQQSRPGPANRQESTRAVVTTSPSRVTNAPPMATASSGRPSARSGQRRGNLLTDGQMAQIRKRFPKGQVHDAVQISIGTRAETLALVWRSAPTRERRCPPEADWSAWDAQACTGFKDALSGSADVAHFAGDSLLQLFPLDPFFQHDANPSGIDQAGVRGMRFAFIPENYGLELHDLNGDGKTAEFLVHVSNGPYAFVEYWVAIGLFQSRLDVAKNDKSQPIGATLAAWLDLARTGQGVSELYCGSRCGDTATRWTIHRDSKGYITERRFWTCTPGIAVSWKSGEPTGPCEH